MSAAWIPTEAPPQVDLLELNDIEALNETTHPIRARLLRALKRPRSALELADEMQSPVTRLYHHLNRLEQAGLIHVVATRRSGAATERRYQAVADSFTLERSLYDELDGVELATVAGGMFDLARAGMQHMFENEIIDSSDLDSRGLLSVSQLRLTPERRRELLMRLGAIIKEFDDNTEGADPLAVFIAAYPDH